MMLARAALAAALFLAWHAPASAEPRRALLIGVSGYDPSVAAIAPRLEGPPNDIALMRDTLAVIGLAPGAVTVLADGGEPDAAPTRANILAALDRLAAEAGPGQEILIYLSGHGAQVPARDGDTDEPDGLDEVFLPADFALRDGAFVNPVRDHELGDAIDRMMAAGAAVWLVADTCHSGSLRRSAGSGAVPRAVDLGAVPAARAPPAPATPEPPLGAARPARQPAGAFTGFYGAEAGELAYEVRIGDGATARTHGLLTWALARALRSGTATRYTDLSREITVELWRTGRGTAAPRFAGALERRHMGRAPETARGFAIAFDGAARVIGGAVDGLAPGARIAIGPAEGPTLFEAEIVEAGLAEARFALPDTPLPALDAAIAAEGLDPSRFRERWLADRAPALVARLVSTPLPLTLPVSVPEAAAMPADLATALDETLDALAPEVERASGSAAAAEIRLEGGRLWLRPADPGAARALSIPATPEALPDLARAVTRLARTERLLSVAGRFRDSPLARPLDTELRIAPGARTRDGCAPWPETETPPPAPERWPAEVRHCDRVEIRVTNTGDAAVDLTPLYLAPDHRTYFLAGYPDSARGGLRIAPGETGRVRYIETTEDADGAGLATGAMSLLLLAVPADPAAPPRDFRYLQDDAPPPLRRTATDSLERLFQAAGFGLSFRSAVDSGTGDTAGAVVIPLRTERVERVSDLGR